MTKVFCDLCGKECDKTYNAIDISFTNTRVGVEIIDICFACCPMTQDDKVSWTTYLLKIKEVLCAKNRSTKKVSKRTTL